MSQLPDLMKRANTTIDGGSYIGKSTYKSPVLKLKTEADENSFLSVEQVVGMEALTAEITLAEFNPAALKLLNVVNGATVPFVFRGSYETSGGVKVKYKEEMLAFISELDPGEKGINKAETKFTVSIASWKLTVAGELIYHISQDKMIVDGVDMMSEHVANAGG